MIPGSAIPDFLQQIPVTITFLHNASNSSNLNSYTFSGVNLGAEAPDRYIIVGVISESLVSSISDVEIDGGGADAIVSSESSNNPVNFWGKLTPTGTTVDIVCATAGPILSGCAICVWSIYNWEGLPAIIGGGGPPPILKILRKSSADNGLVTPAVFPTTGTEASATSNPRAGSASMVLATRTDNTSITITGTALTQNVNLQLGADTARYACATGSNHDGNEITATVNYGNNNSSAVWLVVR